MKQFKEYHNLYEVYRKGRDKLLFAFLGFLLLFLAGAGSMVTDIPFGVTMTLLLMVFPCILFGILALIIKIMTKKFMNRFTQAELYQINNEMPTHAKHEGFIVTSVAVVCCKSRLFLFPMKDLLWVYRHVMTTRVNYIPVWKETDIIFADGSKKRRGCRVRNKSQIEAFLQAEISKYRVGIIFGYDPNLDTIYRKDINQFIGICQDYGRRQLGEMPQV